MLTDDQIERLKAERDAAIALAVHAGKSTFGLTDEESYQLIGRSFGAWLDRPDVREIARNCAAAVRKAAGLEDDSC